MKTAILFTAAFFSGFSLPSIGQQPAAGADQNTSAPSLRTQAEQSAAASAQPAHGTSSAKLSEMALEYMRPVNCELAGKLDSKSARVGDAVVARTTMNLLTADGTEIPRGAKFIGHVSDVQAYASGEAESHLSLVFDHAQWSGGQSVAIHTLIEALTPRPALAVPSMDNGDSMGSATASADARSMGGLRAGGGALGGTAGGAASTAGSLGANPNAGGDLRNTGQTVGDLASNATPSVGPVASVGPVTAAMMRLHATGVPGLLLAGDATGAVSGTLSASRRNVHLDAGTQLTLAVSPVVTQ